MNGGGPSDNRVGIEYVVISRGTCVLAEGVTSASGNANVVTLQVLSQLGDDQAAENTRSSYAQERHIFHMLQAEGLIFLCMVNPKMSRASCFAFLTDIKEKFTKQWTREHHQNALAYTLNSQFGPVLQERMAYYSNHAEKADKVAQVKHDMDNVKSMYVFISLSFRVWI